MASVFLENMGVLMGSRVRLHGDDIDAGLKKRNESVDLISEFCYAPDYDSSINTDYSQFWNDNEQDVGVAMFLRKEIVEEATVVRILKLIPTPTILPLLIPIPIIFLSTVYRFSRLLVPKMNRMRCYWLASECSENRYWLGLCTSAQSINFIIR